MPELPEIESLRRSLEPRLLHRVIRRAELRRPDFAQLDTGAAPKPRNLLAGDRVVSLHRLGKQLAILGASGRVMCVHLGMSGQLLHTQPGQVAPADHVHVRWTLDDGARLHFRDPRRFGGLWLGRDLDSLRTHRWNALGPDALTITPKQLEAALGGSSRSLKAALLDQRALAGVGNIYADEALFRAALHPLTPCRAVTRDEWAALARSTRAVLRDAIRRGGSTLRDYRDANGDAGGFQTRHRVYGREGLACVACETPIVRILVAQRSTCWCPSCQPEPVS